MPLELMEKLKLREVKHLPKQQGWHVNQPHQMVLLRHSPGNSLVVQWLGLCAFTAKGVGSIPGQGTKIPQAAWCGQKKDTVHKSTFH